MMKKYLIIILLSILSLSGFSQNGNITVSGFDTVPPYRSGVKYILKPTRVVSPLVILNDTTMGITGSALTKVDDANVTMTLGGTPTIALLNATSMSLGWNGQLSILRGGSGQSTANAALNAFLPSQTSNSGKYLITDGTNTSWGTVSGGGGQVDSTYFWARSGNVTTFADFLGTKTNTSLNIRTNNLRQFQFDSLGCINVYPAVVNRPFFKVYRGGSTGTVAMTWTNNTADEIDVTTANASITFKNGSGGTAEIFKLSSATPTGTILSPNSIEVKGREQITSVTPTGTAISPALTWGTTGGGLRMSLGTDANSLSVMYLHNTGLRLIHDNGSQIGDFMNVYSSSGNMHLQNKGTYTEETSARLNVSSTNQGVLIPKVTTTQRTNILGSMLTFFSNSPGSGYTTGTYTNVPVIGGVGSGATINVTVAGGTITVTSFNNRGTGYAASTAGLTVNASDVGGTGSGFSMTCSAVATLATGLTVYDTDAKTYYTYNGTAWASTGTVSGSFSGAGTATTTFTVTFGGTQPNTTYKVQVTPTSSLSAALFYVTNKTTTTFDVTYLAGLTGTVTFDWQVVQ